MHRETLEAILSVNFSLFGENFITSFVQPEKKWQIMGEVCDVGPKNLRKNLRVEELFSARNVSHYFPVQRGSSYVSTEARRFYAAVLNICWYAYMTCNHSQNIWEKL